MELSLELLEKLGFKLVKDFPFEDIEMPYYVHNGILLFFNENRMKDEEKDYLIAVGEMRSGKYHAVRLEWIDNEDRLLQIYECLKRKSLI